jgi:hypothetical protein
MIHKPACSSGLNRVNTSYITQQDDFSPTTVDMPQGDQNSLNKEALRRILQKSDRWTKENLRACLSEDLLIWLRLHPRKVETCDCENEEYLVQTIAYIYQVTGYCRVLECDSIDGVMLYLNASLNGLLIDTLKTRSISMDISAE